MIQLAATLIVAVILLPPALTLLGAILGAIFPTPPSAVSAPTATPRPRRYGGTKIYSIPTKGEV